MLQDRARFKLIFQENLTFVSLALCSHCGWSHAHVSHRQSRVRISAEKRKPKAWAWLIFHTQLVRSLAVPDSSLHACANGQHGTWFCKSSFYFFLGGGGGGGGAFERQALTLSTKRKIPCSTKERIKGALRKDLGSSTSAYSHEESFARIPAAGRNTRRSLVYSCFSRISPLSVLTWISSVGSTFPSACGILTLFYERASLKPAQPRLLQLSFWKGGEVSNWAN